VLGWALGYLGNLARIQGDTARARALFEEDLSLFRELGDRRHIAWMLGNLGWLALCDGALDQAAALVAECLALAREIGSRVHIVQSLSSTGIQLSLRSEHARAVSLVAAATALHGSVRATLDSDEIVVLDAALAASRAALGEPAYEAARLRGGAMTWDEAIDDALAALAR
jgi:hypothetical protein